MNNFINLQKEKINNLKKNHNNFCKQLTKINLNPQDQENLGLRLQLLNNDIDELNDKFMEILSDLKINTCEINKDIADKIETYEKTRLDIKKAIPILLCLQINGYL